MPSSFTKTSRKRQRRLAFSLGVHCTATDTFACGLKTAIVVTPYRPYCCNFPPFQPPEPEVVRSSRTGDSHNSLPVKDLWPLRGLGYTGMNNTETLLPSLSCIFSPTFIGSTISKVSGVKSMDYSSIVRLYICSVQYEIYLT